MNKDINELGKRGPYFKLIKFPLEVEMEMITLDRKRKVWVVSDTHFFHKNLCGPTLSSWDRGYRNFSSLEEMNSTIIDNINNSVGEDDILLHLGDFMMGPRHHIFSLRERIKCKEIHLILGNHDEVLTEGHKKYKKEYADLFSSVSHYKEIRFDGTLIVLCHYPLGSWNEMGRGSINLFGHCHSNYSRTLGRQMDVGVDTNNMCPYLLSDVVTKLKNIEVQTVDHHTEKTCYG